MTLLRRLFAAPARVPGLAVEQSTPDVRASARAASGVTFLDEYRSRRPAEDVEPTPVEAEFARRLLMENGDEAAWLILVEACDGSKRRAGDVLAIVQRRIAAALTERRALG